MEKQRRIEKFTIQDFRDGLTVFDLDSSGREHLIQDIMELESFIGVNLLNTRYGFYRNKRLTELVDLVFNLKR